MALLVVLIIVMEGSGEANYVMRVFLSAPSVCARVPESFVRKVSELFDGGCYEVQK
jgi:hypothetical protein